MGGPGPHGETGAENQQKSDNCSRKRTNEQGWRGDDAALPSNTSQLVPNMEREWEWQWAASWNTDTEANKGGNMDDGI
jgi:hypothetical protein